MINQKGNEGFQLQNVFRLGYYYTTSRHESIIVFEPKGGY
jgi:hypothetical protein